MGKMRAGLTIGAVLFVVSVLLAPQVFAGGKIEIGEDKWISVGMGMRASFGVIEDLAPNGDEWNNDFRLENMRLYVNGQMHKYLKFEFNTECTNCPGIAPNNTGGTGGTMIVLDAIAKFEFNPYFNVWAGRLLVPLDRAELDGPFYQNTFDFDKTPFYPSDFGNFAAGRFGRDDGVNVWGAVMDGKLSYVVGVFDGVDGGPNRGDSLLYAGRISYNFLNVEKNPGYYTSSTYYGTGGDILTLAFAINHQAGGAGTAANPGDFTGYSTDLLFEKLLGSSANDWVFTAEGEFKHFDADLNAAALASAGCFCLFDGDAYSVAGLLLFPDNGGFGRFQPYVRWTENISNNSADTSEFEAGTNYVIDGHNARLSLFWQYGNINRLSNAGVPMQFDFTPTAGGDSVHAIKMAVQFQL